MCAQVPHARLPSERESPYEDLTLTHACVVLSFFVEKTIERFEHFSLATKCTTNGALAAMGEDRTSKVLKAA